MTVDEARLLVDHRSPCEELDRARNSIGKIFDRINDPETGLGALNRGLHNSVEWQERIEGRVNQLYLLALTAALSGLASLVVGLALLLAGGKR